MYKIGTRVRINLKPNYDRKSYDALYAELLTTFIDDYKYPMIGTIYFIDRYALKNVNTYSVNFDDEYLNNIFNIFYWREYDLLNIDLYDDF